MCNVIVREKITSIIFWENNIIQSSGFVKSIEKQGWRVFTLVFYCNFGRLELFGHFSGTTTRSVRTCMCVCVWVCVCVCFCVLLCGLITCGFAALICCVRRSVMYIDLSRGCRESKAPLRVTMSNPRLTSARFWQQSHQKPAHSSDTCLKNMSCMLFNTRDWRSLIYGPWLRRIHNHWSWTGPKLFKQGQNGLSCIGSMLMQMTKASFLRHKNNLFAVPTQRNCEAWHAAVRVNDQWMSIQTNVSSSHSCKGPDLLRVIRKSISDPAQRTTPWVHLFLIPVQTSSQALEDPTFHL